MIRIPCDRCDYVAINDSPRVARLLASEHALFDHDDECPAGGAHVWTVQEEPGTGRTGVACDECHAPKPKEADDGY